MRIMIAETDRISGIVADLLQKQLGAKPSSVIGLTTGSTPIQLGIYQEWVNRAKAGNMDFSLTRFINPDELLGLSNNHPETYRMYMRSHLFEHLGTPTDHTYIPDSETKDAELECIKFDRILKELGGIDFQLMGLGMNGHVAFIEPAPEIPASTYVVRLAEENRPQSPLFTTHDSPTQAITMGLRALMQAQSIVLVATGQKKASIVERAFFGPISTYVPASFLQLHRNALILLDEEAASTISDRLHFNTLYGEGENDVFFPLH